MQLLDDNMCFACGCVNPLGLGLTFTCGADGTVESAFTPDQVHQGYAGITHGGIVCTILDEAMAWCLRTMEKEGMTVEMKVRFRRPALTGKLIQVIGRPIRVDKKRATLTAVAQNEGGEVLAEAKGLFLLRNAE